MASPKSLEAQDAEFEDGYTPLHVTAAELNLPLLRSLVLRPPTHQQRHLCLFNERRAGAGAGAGGSWSEVLRLESAKLPRSEALIKYDMEGMAQRLVP